MIEELRENTTLRHAAIESRPRAPAKRTSRPALKLAAALAVPAMVLAAFIVWRSSGDQPARAPAAPLAPAVAVAGPPEPPPPVAAAAPADEPAAAPVPFEVRAFPPEADLALDGQPPSRGRLELVLPLAGDAHELRVSAPGYAAKEIAFGAGQSPPSEIRLEPTAAPVQAARKKKALRAAKPPQAKRGTNDALIIR
jgi:hypothetical protein